MLGYSRCYVLVNVICEAVHDRHCHSQCLSQCYRQYSSHYSGQYLSHYLNQAISYWS